MVVQHPTAPREGARACGGYFGQVADAYERAVRGAGAEVEHEVTIAGQRLSLRFAGRALVEQVIPAIADLAGGRRNGAAASVGLWDSESTGVPMPPVPWRTDAEGLGELRVWIGKRVWAVLDPSASVVTVVDVITKRAYFNVAAPALPWYERAAPLRGSLHWLLMGPRRRLVHAAAVDAGGRGALLVGKSGTGKTTLALACVEAGLDYLGDDCVLLTTQNRPLAHCVYTMAKLSPASLARMPAFSELLISPARSEREKGVLDLRRRHSRIQPSTRIAAVVVPRLGNDRPTSLRRASGATGLLAMGPSTIFQHPGRDAETMETIAELVRAVPCYALEVGPDPAAAAAAIVRLLDVAR